LKGGNLLDIIREKLTPVGLGYLADPINLMFLAIKYRESNSTRDEGATLPIIIRLGRDT